MNNTYHYPPDLFNLLVDTIPLLNKTKKDLLLFFHGSGIAKENMADMIQKVNTNPKTINKYEITRTILSRLNEKSGDKALFSRREIVRRVVQFESYESCWETDRIKAKAYVSEISKIVNVKDSFTRMKDEKEKEAKINRENYVRQVEEKRKKRDKIESIKTDLSNAFLMKNSFKRAKLFEDLLNDLFKTYGISIRESFSIKGDKGEGIVEQIDGVINIDSHIYLVEMKWWKEPIGKGDIAQHLVNVYNRSGARGIFISASPFTEPAVTNCKENLSKITVVFCELRELMSLLEREDDLTDFFRKKINVAIIEKNPHYMV